MCRSWCEMFISVVVLVFAIWDIPRVSRIFLIVAGVVLFIHSITCRTCFECDNSMQKPRRRK